MKTTNNIKSTVLILSVFTAICALAVPRVDQNTVTMEQLADRTVVVSYVLTEDPGIVTFDVETNVTGTAAGPWVSIGGKNIQTVAGAVNKLVGRLNEKLSITWRPYMDWPGASIPAANIRAVVTAWATNAPPDYMAVDLDSTTNVSFYTSADFLPGSITSKVWRTRKLLMRKIPAANVVWRMGQPAEEHPNVYNVMAETAQVMLTEDYFRTQRDVQEAAGGNGIVNVVRMAQDTFARSLSKKSGDTNIGGILTDLYEREVYGRKKKDEGTVSLFGVDVSTAKAVDWLTGYTSRTGLVVNMLGAQANALVGKIQMHIEAVAGEFYDIKDLAAGEVAYFRHLPAYLNEYLSNNKKSFLGLLGDRFNIMEDFYQELRDKGFHTSAIGKILGNTNLFMLYGMGEHLLHFEPALAVLHAHKVYDTKTKNEVTLLQALEESYKEMDNATPDAKNLMFYLNRQRYQWLEGEEKRSITDNDILQVEKRITYVNKSMHGAFNDLEKGMASRYAAGRLIMNFRQWMPAHYERRFRGLHYDADLGDDREGYYVSSVKFLWGCIKDLGDRRMQIATRWNELSDMEKYNLKRCIAEIQTLALLSVANLSLGEYKDKKGNWAYRNLMYQVKRMLMETRASTPIPDLIPMLFGKQAQPLAFVDNIMQLLVSPFAAVNTIQDIVSIMDFSKLLITIEGGKYDGENKYFHDLKKVLPYYGSIRKQIGLADEDYIFQIFE